MILRDSIELHGFDSEELFYQWGYDNAYKIGTYQEIETLYQGKLSEVTNAQAEEWVKEIEIYDNGLDGRMSTFYKDYTYNNIPEHVFIMSLESLKSATDKEWIIITKTQ